MIAGIGTDLVSIARIRDVLDRHRTSFAKRILSDAEFVIFQDVKAPVAATWLAKRWAAKEAFAKAAGTGMRAPLAFRAIAVVNDAQGKPSFHLAPAIVAWLNANNIVHTHLSLSDEQTHAIAFVVFER
jgi:holo-[acyl-carrier protein] synthase